MKADDWLRHNTKVLTENKVSSARLDAMVLLEDATGKDRSWLLAHPEIEITKQQTDELSKLIERRANHEPLAYIRGKSEFYGREFIVTPSTLQPRPETETMIELFLKTLIDKKPVLDTVVDVGTGSGAIAITIKLEQPNLNVYATEINQDTLETSRQNSFKHRTNIEVLLGDLIEPIRGKIAKSKDWAVLANLPYVPDSHTINKAAMQEPEIAIFGGSDGLEHYRRMFDQLDRLDHRPVYIFTESLPFQHEQLSDIALKHDYKPVDAVDLIQVFALA